MTKSLNKIIWLASYPKSGNTWFRMFLSNLFSTLDEPVSINNIIESNIASQRDLFDNFAGVNSSDLSDKEIGNLRPMVYEALAAELAEPIFMKVHEAWQLNSKNKPLFPTEVTKGVLYFIRHPLDVAVSFANHDNISVSAALSNINRSDLCLGDNDEKLTYQFKQRLSSWSEHVTSWIDHSNLPIHVVKYEDMYLSPEKTFSNALRYLDINYDRTAVKRAIRNSSFHILKKQEASYGFKEKPVGAAEFFKTGKIGSWQNYMNNKQAIQFLEAHKTILQKFGYYKQL